MIKKTFVLVLTGFLIISTAAFASTIQLPQTGQTKCYNTAGNEINCSGTGQDGDIRAGKAWPNPRFELNGDCVTDKLTGLMWAKNGNLANAWIQWQAALDYVASIDSGAGLCGYHDWRLPNVNELESLINAGHYYTATWLNEQGFTNIYPGAYWSSNSLSSDTAWYVSMDYGDVWFDSGNKNGGLPVWPVRTGETWGVISLPQTGQKASYAIGDDGDMKKGVVWPTPRFTESGDCVTDNLTGLMWAKNADLPNGERTWQESLDYVASIDSGAGLCGYHDWRLPNRKELRSLIDYSKSDPPLPGGHPFINVLPSVYWSSTTDASFISAAWYVFMLDGRMSATSKDNAYLGCRVWPVRAGQSGSFSDVPPGFWAYDYIMAIYNAGFTTGYPDGTYRPALNVTRAQMAAFIIRAKFGEEFSYSTTQHFSDIPDTHWAFKYVQKMYDEGITTGYPDGTYRPAENVNRAQMATFIIRALFGDSFSYTVSPYFSDIPNTHWAFKYVQKMYDEGITTGYTDGTYRPSQNVNRAQMATFIARAFLGME